MIAIVDYKAGNLTSVATAVKSLNKDCVITSDPEVIRSAERVIFPGVGAAGSAMQNLIDMGLVDVLKEVTSSGKPFLGICVGCQIMFEHSEEDDTQCLGILEGNVLRFPDDMMENERALKIPHMGWNEVRFVGNHPVWNDIEPGSEFYFVHSYYPSPVESEVSCRSDYGIDFACGAVKDNIVVFQFHPEKSGRPGLKLIENFLNWTPESC